jgi:hypothetical protein
VEQHQGLISDLEGEPDVLLDQHHGGAGGLGHEPHPGE